MFFYQEKLNSLTYSKDPRSDLVRSTRSCFILEITIYKDNSKTFFKKKLSNTIFFKTRFSTFLLNTKTYKHLILYLIEFI